MLIRFWVENYRCFRGRAKLDFTDKKNYRFGKMYVRGDLLGKIVLIGNNGSGKSSFGYALCDIITTLTGSTTKSGRRTRIASSTATERPTGRSSITSSPSADPSRSMSTRGSPRRSWPPVHWRRVSSLPSLLSLVMVSTVISLQLPRDSSLVIPGNMLIHHLADSKSVSAVLPIPYALVLVLISVILTLIGGFIPATKAANKDPVTALRTE